MKESEVIIFVDRNPDSTPGMVQQFVRERVEDIDERHKFEVVGLSRLAGSYQIQGRIGEHKEVIKMLRLEYGLWCD